MHTVAGTGTQGPGGQEGNPLSAEFNFTNANAGLAFSGNSILYIVLKLIIKGRYLPAGGLDVQLGPMAWAAWVGLLVTFINLMPIGQLDGGHVAFAFFGNRYQAWMRRLHMALVGVFACVFGVLFGVGRHAGLRLWPAARYALSGSTSWLVWAGLLWLLRRMSGGLYHPEVGPEPLSRRGRAVCILVGVVFVLLFMPVPMREGL